MPEAECPVLILCGILVQESEEDIKLKRFENNNLPISDGSTIKMTDRQPMNHATYSSALPAYCAGYGVS